ncbi:kinesin-like protein KIF13A [Mytilus edulis]|uniref:kinesin-like protein KIF13A n=1 Tax=Mytilus edulis TaxID=6550 RepID=UPI0039EF2A47
MSTDKVRVAVRVRPFNRREIQLSTKCVIDMEPTQTVLYSPHDGGGDRAGGGRKTPKTFAFDHCFWSIDESNPKFAGQDHVFNALGKDVLERAFEGYNACIFAYGQTGSGKSYTMMGTFQDTGHGIIPRLCNAMFSKIDSHCDDESLAVKVEVSYMEIYNEKVHDLLDPKGSKQNLKVREHNILGPYVDGLSQLAVASFEDIDNLMSEGNKSRTVAATNMNNESSRSHAVFNIILTQTLTDISSGVSGEKASKISLVDLAGSERAQKTGAVGDRLKEGSNINKSLTTLGLVISALADQSAGKKKDKFVPYRDSVLTWLLKDNLGGNSKTVMVATLSPSADNYEETLSTLRYADRAKRIVNHAVINEDPNAKIIHDLRSELENLKCQLNEAQSMKAPNLKERLEESEKIMKEMTKTWEEKLKETEKIHKERHDALEQMGVSVEKSGIKVETGKYFLVNLNADPSLNELLVYYLKDHTLVGRVDAPKQQDIQLSGLGIMPEHCMVDVENNDVYVSPLEGARTCVNGSLIAEKTRVRHGDRILWGINHFFRINCPKLNSPQSATEPEQQIDYSFAQQELMDKQFSNDPIQEAIEGIVKQHQEDKEEALEQQRKQYERQMQLLRNQIMSPGTPSMPILPFSMNFTSPTGSTNSGIQKRYQKWAEEREKTFKQSLVKLREEVAKANASVQEANVLAQEMGKRTEFHVTLQIPACNLSPNRRRGTFVSEPAILVKRKNRANQIWSMEKFENKLIDMRDMYEERKSQGLPMMVLDEVDDESGDDGPAVKGDPFYESQENHNLIGVANVFLECLFHDVKLDYHVPIISQQGEVSGKLHIEISKLGGSFMDRYGDINEDEDDESPVERRSAPMIVRIRIHQAKGLPPALCHFVFCQYTFWGHDESVVVPPEIHPDAGEADDTKMFIFKHSKDFKVQTTEEFIEYCQDGALSIEVWGHRSQGFNINDKTVDNVNIRSRSLSERWQEVMRKIEMFVDVQELNHQGEYVPVVVQPRPDVPSAGVFQLQQGHTRRIGVKVKPSKNSGTLPLICESISSVSVGCICSRSKMTQKGLDSYQEEDLTLLRDRWSEALERRKEYLNEQIQKLINKQDKSESDADRERALMDQWVCLTEERNAVMVPSPGSGIPGAPADWDPPDDIERHTPVVFLDLNADDLSTPSAREGLQAAGFNSILPKEQSSQFFNLPIIKNITDKDSISAVVSWDSSIHDSPSLNRVTSSNERVYMILKAVIRLSHPAYLEIVLRKRICLNIYTNFSITSLTDRLKKKITGQEKLFSSGISYEVVSNIPKASEDLENMETLAQMAASQNEVTADGETYIEKYIKGVSAVESILTLDRLRQEVKVKELTAAQGRALRKTTSTPNIPNAGLTPTKFDGQLRADSIQDLSCDSLSPGRRLSQPARPNFLSLRGTGITAKPASPKSLLSPMGSKVKPMSTLVEEQQQRESKPLLKREDSDEEFDEADIADIQRRKFQSVIEPEPNSVSSDDFQDFESYQSQQPQPDENPMNSTAQEIPHSSTNDSLAEIQGKNFTPSLVSSGYGSQAVSMLTLSSEDSLSLRSMEDNNEGHKDSRGSQKGSIEQSSESDEDQQGVSDVCHSESDERSPECNSTNVMEASDSDSNKTVLSQEKLETVENGESYNMDISSTETSKGAESNAESKLTGARAIGNKTVDAVDPYSETAMEELEKLGFDEEEEDIQEDKNNGSEIELFIAEENDEKSAKNKTTEKLLSNKSFTPPSTLEKTKGVIKRPQRPLSCVLPVDQSVIEESMKRNSLQLHMSDEEDIEHDDSLSTCSFGSRADLDRLSEVPVPAWIIIGESVIVTPSKGPQKTGVVQFVGPVEFAAGPWVGVELDLPEGKNDGSVNGIRYFKCRSRHGIFVRHDKLILDKKRRGSRKRASTDSKRAGNIVNRSPANQTKTGNSGNFIKGTASSSAKKKL